MIFGRKFSFLILVLLCLFSITGTADSAEPLVGEQFQIGETTYQIESLLGKGGIGYAYKVTAVGNPKDVRVAKFLFYRDSSITNFVRRRDLLTSVGLLQNMRDGERTLLYTPMLAKIALHPNRPKDAFDNGVLYSHPDSDFVIISPLAQSDLENVATKAETGPDRILLAQRVLNDILPEIALLSKNGYVHSDIKPQNILMSQDGRFGLNDFDGLVPFGKEIRLATWTFSPPEWIENKANYLANTNFDIYSLAKTLLRILAGKKFDTTANYSELASQLESLNDHFNNQVLTKSPELKSVFDEMMTFLKAALKSNPEDRHNDLKNTKFAKYFEKVDGSYSHESISIGRLSPELRSLKAIFDSSSSISETQYLKNLQAVENAPGLVQEALKEKDLFLKAYRAAQILGLPLESYEKELTETILKVGVSDQQWFTNVEEIVAKGMPLSKAVAEALFKRFILPKNSLYFSKSFYELVSHYPELVKKHENTLLKRIQDHRERKLPFADFVYPLSLLFMNYETIPNTIKGIWIESLGSIKSIPTSIKEKLESSLNSTDSENPLRLILENPSMSSRDKVKAIEELQKMSRYKIGPKDIAWLKQITRSKGVDIYTDEVKLSVGVLLLQQGHESIGLLEFLIKNRSSPDFSELRNLKFSLNTQKWLAKLLTTSKNRNEIVDAFNLLSNQIELADSVRDYLSQRQIDSNFHTEFSIAKLLVTQKNVEIKRSIHILLEALGDDRYKQKPIYELLSRGLSRVKMDDSLAVHLKVKNGDFSKGFRENGIDVEKITEDFSHVDAEVKVFQNYAFRVETKDQAEIVIKELEKSESGNTARARDMLEKIAIELIDPLRLEKIVKENPYTRSGRYAATILFKRFKMWNPSIEAAYLHNMFQETVPAQQYSRASVLHAFNVLENSSEIEISSAKNSIVRILGNSKLLPSDWKLLERLESGGRHKETIDAIYRASNERAKKSAESPPVGEVRKEMLDLQGLASEKLIELLKDEKGDPSLYKLLRERDLNESHLLALREILDHSNADSRIVAAATLQKKLGAWDSKVQDIFFDMILFGNEKWNYDYFVSVFEKNAVNVSDIERLFKKALKEKAVAKFFVAIRSAIESPAKREKIKKILYRHRNSFDPETQVLAAYTLHLAGVMDKRNKHVFLEYGAALLNYKWIIEQFPVTSYDQSDVDSLLRGIPKLSEGSTSYALSILNLTSNELVLKSPLAEKLLDSNDEKVRLNLASRLLHQPNAPEKAVSLALDAVTRKIWNQSAVIKVIKDFSVELSRVHYEWLVSDFLNNESPTRSFSYEVLRTRLPLPRDLAEKIEFRYQGQNHLEVLGSKMKQPKTNSSCQKFYNKSI